MGVSNCTPLRLSCCHHRNPKSSCRSSLSVLSLLPSSPVSRLTQPGPGGCSRRRQCGRTPSKASPRPLTVSGAVSVSLMDSVRTIRNLQLPGRVQTSVVDVDDLGQPRPLPDRVLCLLYLLRYLLLHQGLYLLLSMIQPQSRAVTVAMTITKSVKY